MPIINKGIIIKGGSERYVQHNSKKLKDYKVVASQSIPQGYTTSTSYGCRTVNKSDPYKEPDVELRGRERPGRPIPTPTPTPRLAFVKRNRYSTYVSRCRVGADAGLK